MATRAELTDDIRNHLNDVATAANYMWPSTEIYDALNRSYRHVASVIRRHTPGYFQKLGYLSSSTTLFTYTLPTDCIRLIRVRVDPAGTDLSATPSSQTATQLSYAPPSVFSDYEQNLTGAQVYSFRGQKLLIAPAFPLAASNSIELWYEHTVTSLSADTSSPAFPSHYHDILIPLTARWLKAARNMDTSFEEQEVNVAMTNLLIDLKTMDTETEQFRTQLDRTQNYYDPSGQGVSRSGFHGDG